MALTLCITSAISLASVTIPGFFTFSPGTPISSSEINSNFEKLATLIQGQQSQVFMGTWNASSNIPTSFIVSLLMKRQNPLPVGASIFPNVDTFSTRFAVSSIDNLFSPAISGNGISFLSENGVTVPMASSGVRLLREIEAVRRFSA